MTEPQLKLLRFIDLYQREKGIIPSFEEMRIGMGLRSKSAIHSLINGLIKRGVLEKINRCARSLKILQPLGAPLPSPLMTREKISDPSLLIESDAAVKVACYGMLTAEFSVNVFLNKPQEFYPCPVGWFGPNTDTYTDYVAFRMAGDSLKDAHILDGDTLIFHLHEPPSLDMIVMVVVDGAEVHVKRYEQLGDQVRLSTANKYMMPRVYEAHRVAVRGYLARLVR